MDKKFNYLVSYSLKKRVAKKSFIVVNVILLILTLALVNLGSIIQAFGGDFNDEVKIYLVDDSLKGANEVLKEIAKESNFIFEDKTEFNVDNKDEYLKDYDAVLVLKANEKGYIYADCYLDEMSLTNETKLSSFITNVKSAFWLLDHSELSAELEDFNNSPTINYNRSEDDESALIKTINTAVSMIIAIPCFMLLIFLVQFIGIDIIEEKSSRSIEVIISNVPAGTHFASKIISTLIFMVIQGGLLFVYMGLGALISMIIGGASSGDTTSLLALMGENNEVVINAVLSKLPITLITIALFMVAGFTMYLVMTAVLSSMCTTMEDFQSFQTPIMIMLLLSFYIAIFGVQFDGSVFLKIMGFIPFFSPILAPIVYLNGAYTIWELLISFLLLVLTAGLFIYFGRPLYKASILDYSEGGLIKKFKSTIKKSKYVE